MAHQELVQLLLADTILRQKVHAPLAVEDCGVPLRQRLQLRRELDLLHLRPVRLQQLHRLPQRGLRAGPDVRPDHRLQKRDLCALDLEGFCGRLVVGEGEDVREQLQVLDAPREEAERVEDERVDLLALARDGVPGGFEGVDAVEGGRADGATAGLRAEGERGLEVGDGGAGAGGGAAGGAGRRGGGGVRVYRFGAGYCGCEFCCGCFAWEGQQMGGGREGEGEVPRRRAPASRRTMMEAASTWGEESL